MRIIKVLDDMKVWKSSTPEEVKKCKKVVFFCLSEDKNIILEQGKEMLTPLCHQNAGPDYALPNVPAKLWAHVVSSGELQHPQGACSASSWSITRGQNLAQEPWWRGLLLTYNEDHTVQFWEVPSHGTVATLQA
ncbi:hypothetical protein GH733_009280 [Mirounga leonina]|nr:hypothetical protein GH733_009280 [Mirounga leonina]